MLTFEEIMTGNVKEKLVKEISNCRLCKSNNISVIWDFGLSPLANKFKNSPDEEEFQAPLRYFKCNQCHSVQLKDEVSSEILFKDYLYESPPNLQPHFQELAETTFNFLGLKPGDRVMDIGSNNGLLLEEYKKLECKVVGIEPANNIAQKARDRGIPTISEFFSPLLAEEFALQYKAPKLITSTNCFAHVSDLNEFVEALTILMGKDSYFVFENAYLLNTIDNLDFGQAYFEHFYMHSVYPLTLLFNKHGLDFFHVEYNKVQMGSIRGYVRKLENRDIHFEIPPTVKAHNEEFARGLDKPMVYNRFLNKIVETKNQRIHFLEQAKKNESSISVYGWPAKMTLLNKYFGLEKYIDYVVEESSLKIGKFCPGTRLEVKDKNYFVNNPTDYCIIGAYNFEKDIVAKNKDYKGIWINPLK